MIGWVTTQEAALAIEAQVKAAFIARDRPLCWLPGWHAIATGDYASQVPGVTNVIIPMSDTDKQQRLNNGTRVMDYPEYATMAAALGGDESRVDVDPDDLWTPEEP